ncbi:MAG: hypothetical protein N3B18_13785 [Desulfobacterota bacterium]|nr:hypothetical protein [Thermodesulfobacteriota bacterium]
MSVPSPDRRETDTVIAMNLAALKASSISRRKLFEVERLIVRQVVDLWCKEKSYIDHNFAQDVDVTFSGKRISISFANTVRMRSGQPEATINEVMRGLILTMATDAEGNLLKNQEAIIGNILDVFIHRLREIADRKFILQRLQSLELGFAVAFGLDKKYAPIKKARHFLDDVVTVASLSNAQETVETLIRDMHESTALGPGEHGVTFHIVMEKPDVASFISLPLRTAQANYVSLLGNHALRCNIIAELSPHETISTGVLKIDAPSNPLKFIRHKGFTVAMDMAALMEKLGSSGIRYDFSAHEMLFLKLLFNEYVQLASFLLSSNRITPALRLLMIFPRVNMFSILRQTEPRIPAEEPQTLGELAQLADRLFSLPHPTRKQKTKKHRIPERVIQARVAEAILALARTIVQQVYKPLFRIRRILAHYEASGFADTDDLSAIKRSLDEISASLRRLSRIQGFVQDSRTGAIDIEASIAWHPPHERSTALEEIVSDIQAAEIEQTRDVIVSKMLDYLSSVTVRLEQLEKVSSQYIKQEIARDVVQQTTSVLDQARSFYRLVVANVASR